MKKIGFAAMLAASALLTFGTLVFGIWVNQAKADFEIALNRTSAPAVAQDSPSIRYSSDSTDKLAKDAENCGKESALLAAMAIKAGNKSELINKNIVQFEYDRAKELGYSGSEQERFVKISDACFRYLMEETYKALKRNP